MPFWWEAPKQYKLPEMSFLLTYITGSGNIEAKAGEKCRCSEVINRAIFVRIRDLSGETIFLLHIVYLAIFDLLRQYLLSHCVIFCLQRMAGLVREVVIRLRSFVTPKSRRWHHRPSDKWGQNLSTLFDVALGTGQTAVWIVSPVLAFRHVRIKQDA